jgi:hypothetical protein
VIATATITAGHFPTPHRALRGGVDRARVCAFADLSAVAANAVHTELVANWSPDDTTRRAHAITTAYAHAQRWRAELAPGDDALRASSSTTTERFTIPITDDEPNCDRFGHCGRFRVGSTFDPATGLYIGGTSTPASRIAHRYGQLIEARFAVDLAGAEILDNPVRLPDGDIVVGNRLTRGAAAEMTAQHLAARVAARGIDATTMETGPRGYYAITATENSRARIRAAAFAFAADRRSMTTLDWWTLAYLLYQAPERKKGSDAVHRVFLAAVGALLCERIPVLRHDIDLWCMTAGQTAVLTAATLT